MFYSVFQGIYRGIRTSFGRKVSFAVRERTALPSGLPRLRGMKTYTLRTIHRSDDSRHTALQFRSKEGFKSGHPRVGPMPCTRSGCVVFQWPLSIVSVCFALWPRDYRAAARQENAHSTNKKQDRTYPYGLSLLSETSVRKLFAAPQRAISKLQVLTFRCGNF